MRPWRLWADPAVLVVGRKASRHARRGLGARPLPADAGGPLVPLLPDAHANLILLHLRGDETVRLDGLILGGVTLTFKLPGVALVAHHEWFDGRAVTARLTLDGLHMDPRQPNGPWRAELTWRGWVAQCPSYNRATLAWTDLAEADRLPVQGERGLELAEAAQ